MLFGQSEADTLLCSGSSGQDPAFWAKANAAAEAGTEGTEPASEEACGFPNILQSKAKPAVLTCCEQ